MDITLKYFENAKAQIKAEEERQIQATKERVLREIQPKFSEIEQLKSQALNKLSTDYTQNRNSETERYNAQLVALQQKYESDKKSIAENTEKKKEEILNATLQTETYQVTKDCERAIADIDNLIAKRAEKE
jgi:phage host-nuclease inhibitor protein Gam